MRYSEEVELRNQDKWVACDKCEKWRNLGKNGKLPEEGEQWFCSMNPDPKLAKLDRHVGSFCGGAWNDYAETQAIRAVARRFGVKAILHWHGWGNDLAFPYSYDWRANPTRTRTLTLTLTLT